MLLTSNLEVWMQRFTSAPGEDLVSGSCSDEANFNLKRQLAAQHLLMILIVVESLNPTR
jgi:hypothetical protein